MLVTKDTAASPRQKLEWLQALRGVAALMVLFFHMTPYWKDLPVLGAFTGAMHFGFAGVDVFFVLSGFVVYASARQCVGLREVSEFVKRRMLRIYMGYWPVLLVFAAVPWIVKGAEGLSWERVLRSVFLLYPNISDNWVPTAWSLTYELFFYAWLALVSLCAGPAVRLRVVAALLAVVVAWNTVWLMAASGTMLMGQQPLRFGLTGYAAEFLAGALVFEWYVRYSSARVDPWVVLPACGAVVLLGFAVGSTSPYFDRVEIMRAGSYGVAAIGFLGTALALQRQAVRAPLWLVRIGDASFSVYLIHIFLLSGLGYVRYTYLGGGTTLGSTLFAASYPVLIVLIGWLWYRGVELPLMRWTTPPRAGAAASAGQWRTRWVGAVARFGKAGGSP